MAGEWVESAAWERTAGAGAGDAYKHTLTLARADEAYEAAERVRARRAVLRLAGGAVADVLAALGLPALTETERSALLLERERVRDVDALAGEAWPVKPSRVGTGCR